MNRQFTAAALLCLILSNNIFAQSGNASVGGFVQDATQAFIPGVTVTAANTQTGVVTTAITNEAGTYNIPGLLPGTYRLSAELPGFRSHIYNNVQLGTNAAARYNFKLEVGQLTDSVEVTAEATALLAESSPTIGQVLPEKQVRALPLVTNNVLDLMQTMAGVRGPAIGESATFAGISTGMVNTSRDGLSVQDGRYANGVYATTTVHPDMVGEFRVILTPVDAELGRGNGQVQILTRSGTNQYRGTSMWSVRNTALDANTWSNNKQVVNGRWTPGQPTWINRNQVTGSLGGPIIKNKTFFFVLWDQQFERQRQTVRPVVLTDCARNGVFRYWSGWANGNTQQAATTLGANPTIASVDSSGNPLRPATNPDGTPYTGDLRFFSVFGPVTNTPTRPDCTDAIIGSAPTATGTWDVNRTRMDPIGVSQKFLGVMPQANIFDGGDGLNTAVHQWVRRAHNAAAYGLATGNTTDTDRHQINTKVDHNFSASHKVAVNYSHEWLTGEYLANINQWPGGYGNEILRQARVLTANFTSTLSPSLLNEARFGYRESRFIIWAPWEVTDPKKREVPLSFMLQGGQGFPIAYSPANVQGATTQTAMNPNNFSCFAAGCAQTGNRTPLYNYADTISWNKGKHGFKGGAELRFSHSRGNEIANSPIPKATGGAGNNPNLAFQNATTFPGLRPNNQTMANSLLYFLSGSLQEAFQFYFLKDSNDLTKWEHYLTQDRRYTEPHQNEFALFFKDDWKVTPSFTVNLGLRYEYYGVPYEGQGLTIRPANGAGLALFGVSGRSFDRWMRPDNGVDLNLLTQVEFVGPKTKQPNESIYPNDWNNFGPAVGFAWQLPWFGKGKTNVRGGYQVTYPGGGHQGNLANLIFSTPGFLHRASGPSSDGAYYDTRNLSSLVPIPPTTLPMQPIPIQKMNQAAYAYDPSYTTPYIQNLTLSVTRQISRKLSLDVRYIGTRGVKLNTFFDLNAPNVFYNPALFDALERTRRGENVALFDQMFLGLNLNAGVLGCDPANPAATCAAVNGTTQRGSQHLRLSSTFRDALANGDFAAVANSINVFNGVGSSAVAGTTPAERGTVLKRANSGFNVPGGITIAGGPVVPAGLFPSNWITTNPQFSSANFWTNAGKSNYHSLQVQGTLRPMYGLSLQGTYVWSRSLEVPLSGASLVSGLNSVVTYTNPAERNNDYALSPGHVTHDFRSYGTFELPIGPNKLLLGNSSGWVARTVEGWDTSFILNLSSGQPVSIGAGNMLYGLGVADVAGPLSLRNGDTKWQGDFGNYFGSGTFSKVSDPQCAALATELGPYCTLQAVTDAKTGQILIQNPRPGKRGTVGRQTLELPGQWSFDAAMSKTVRISESKNFQVRLDAINVFNHPVPNNPVLNLNANNAFGFIQDKSDSRRQFKATLRLLF